MSAREDLPVTAAEAAAFLVREARLIDDRKLAEWLALFTADAIYSVPLDENAARGTGAAIIYDDALGREERVHHLLHNRYPSQSPRSRTLHFVSNIEATPGAGGTVVRSSQIVYETRPGDYQQIGLGQVGAVVADVEHVLVRESGALRIARKTVLLLNRDAWFGNLTYLL